jgi:hypothetical protein
MQQLLYTKAVRTHDPEKLAKIWISIQTTFFFNENFPKMDIIKAAREAIEKLEKDDAEEDRKRSRTRSPRATGRADTPLLPSTSKNSDGSQATRPKATSPPAPRPQLQQPQMETSPGASASGSTSANRPERAAAGMMQAVESEEALLGGAQMPARQSTTEAKLQPLVDPAEYLDNLDPAKQHAIRQALRTQDGEALLQIFGAAPSPSQPFPPLPPSGSSSSADLTTKQSQQASGKTVGAVPGQSRRWARLRAEYPPEDPKVLLSKQFTPTWAPTADENAMELMFCAKNHSKGLDDMLVEFYRACAECSLYVDDYYKGTQWESNINAYAGGTAYVPAVRIKSLKVTVNWFATKDGRLRIDGGGSRNQELALEILRIAMPRYTPNLTAHGLSTGYRASSEKVIQSNEQAYESAKRDWDGRHKNEVLVLGASTVFDPLGNAGIWDRLNKSQGAKSVPRSNASPWAIALDTGPVVVLHIDGRAYLHFGCGRTLEAIKMVESILRSDFDGKWTSESVCKAEISTGPVRIKYGIPGPAAREMDTNVGFR